MSFDPNKAAISGSGVFGLPFDEAKASLILLPVPWEATTSYRPGTANAPSAILKASKQVDLYDLDVLKPYEAGIFLLPESPEVRSWNEKARPLAQSVIEAGGETTGAPSLERALETVNQLGRKLNEFVYSESRRILTSGKILGVIGGDHSVPFGAIQALAEENRSFGILHIDAHSDTRKAFEGFAWSHASIMRNVLEKIPQVSELVQVGIRDLCEEEMDFISAQGSRIRFHSDRELSRRKFLGATWAQLVQEMISALPQQVWISFDIDGLDPRFCPHTGTPVPGGLDFHEANFLLGAIVRSGRRILGFDLNEVAPGPAGDEWDANVGARVLYKLSAWTLASLGKTQVLN